MMSQTTYTIFMTKGLSNKILHFVLIALEYIVFILPSVLDSLIKINFYGNTSEVYSKVSASLDQLNILKYFHIFIALPLVFASLSLLLIIFYVAITFLGFPMKRHLKFLQWAITFTYDIVFFRYLSSLFHDSLMYLTFYFFNRGGLIGNILSFLFILLYFIILITTYQHIIIFTMMISVTNPLLVHEDKSYPYDNISKEYDIPILIIKAIIAIEFNYCEYSKDIDSVVISLNIAIILLSVLLFLRLVYAKFCYRFSLTLLYSNLYLNYLRKSITIFNFSTCIIGIIILSLDINIVKSLIYAIIISINITFCYVIPEYYFLMNRFIEKHPLSYQVLLLMLINDVKRYPILFKKLSNSCYFNHQLDCKIDTCSICLHHGDNLNDNFRLFYKYYRKNKKAVSFDEDLVQLLYYKISKKTFKFFLNYYSLIHKYGKKNSEFVRNLKLIVECWIIKENDEQSEMIINLIKLASFEVKIRNLLKKMDMFFKDNIIDKHPETVVNLSAEINNILNESMEFVRISINQKNISTHSENSTKVINNIFSYNVMIFRFILECLVNKQLDDMNPLSIELYEEYLSNHYHFDQILICMVDLSSTVFHNIKLIKATGELSHKNKDLSFLCEYFPKAIKKNGIELMYDVLRKTDPIYAEQKIFDFPFISLGVLSVIKYSFNLFELIDNNQLILYGQYFKDNKKYLLLKRQDQFCIEIISFCKEMLKLIFFPAKWLPYLKEMNFKFTLTSFFSSVQINNNFKQIECEFDYAYFIKHFKNIIRQLKEISKFKANPKNEVKLSSMQKSLKNHLDTKLKITFEKVIKYSDKIMLYQLHMNECRESNISIINSQKQLKNWEDKNFEDNKTYSFSNGSFSVERTTESKSTSKKMKADEFQNLNLVLKKKIEKGTTSLSIYSMMMIGLNIVLIIICIVFLITQITQTQLLVSIIDFYFKFKILRIVIVNFFVTLTSTVCMSKNFNQIEDCENSYAKYNEYFIEKYGLDPEFNFLEYLNLELKMKADFGLNILINFKEIVYTHRNLKFEHILTNEMIYLYFEDNLNQLTLSEELITFEEGFRRFCNRIHEITLSKIPYSSIPIYYISYVNGIYSFENVPNGTLSLLQQSIYLGIINYVNYFSTFNESENIILSKIFSLKNMNEIFNYTFMITLGILNLFLLFVCHKNIQTAYHLFKMIIINSICKTEEKECNKVLRNKMSNLSILVNLYEKNPNYLIQKINSEKHYSNNSSNGNNIAGTTEKEIKYQNKDDFNKNKAKIRFGASFKKNLLKQLIGIYIGNFILYFVVIIIFDIVLITKYNQVFLQFDYLYLEHEFENYIYVTIGFTLLSTFGNYTNEDFAQIVGRENPQDGILNYFVRVNIENYRGINSYTKKNSSLYPVLEDFFNEYTCNGVFTEHDDIYFITISEKLKKDYRKVSIVACEQFKSLNTPNFQYLMLDLIHRTQLFINDKIGNDYNSVYAFTNSFKYYELCTITLFEFRVLYKTYREFLLVPAITKNFGFYVDLVGIYLSVNIILEIIIFIIVKWFISKRLMIIQKNLYLFNNCLN